MDDVGERMLNAVPTTLAGFQALARCLVLSAGDVRDAVAGESRLEYLGFSLTEWAMTVVLLRALTGGTLTDANCTDGPMWFVPETVRCSVSARVNRRHLLGGCTAGALLFGVAGAGKAAELDRELLGLVAALERQQGAIDALEPAGEDYDWSALDGLQDGFWSIADRISATPARTPEGMQAKAKALRLVYLGLKAEDDSHMSRHLLGLVRDLWGRGEQ